MVATSGNVVDGRMLVEVMLVLAAVAVAVVANVPSSAAFLLVDVVVIVDVTILCSSFPSGSNKRRFMSSLLLFFLFPFRNDDFFVFKVDGVFVNDDKSILLLSLFSSPLLCSSIISLFR